MNELIVMVLVTTLVLGALVRGWFLGYEAARPEAPSLNAKEQAVLLAAADAMFPRGGVLPISGSEAGVLHHAEATFRASPERTRLLLRLLLRFVEHGPWLLNLRPRLTRQAPAKRVDTLRSWAESRLYFLRVTFTSLRTLISLAYLADKRVLHRMGATPDPTPFEGSKQAVVT
ncbi:MAG: hypothetical protein RMJ98_19565 [Myxococcales bacterium]|nr:hypothetical protein [Myxococcales bacterium]